MLATLSKRADLGADWVFEPKLDGVRVLAVSHAGVVTLLSRTGKVQNAAYPEVVDALRARTGGDWVVDGEVVALHAGRPSFSRLQQRMHVTDPARARATGVAVHYYAFDLLFVEGVDVRRVPLLTRKHLLSEAFAFGETVTFSRHLTGDGPTLLAAACDQGWEGLVAKRLGGRYTSGRSRDWLKLKCVRRQEFVIGGWTEPEGTRASFGALLLGYHESGALRFAGKVGTGFDTETLADIGAKLAERAVPESPFAAGTIPATIRRRSTHWVRPDLVCEVTFAEWTPDGRLRHPAFVGLRTDKSAETVTREVAPEDPLNPPSR